MTNFKHLEDKIKLSYEQGVTQDEAERLAGEFLLAQIEISELYRQADLDARMRKSGLKAIKATLYLEEVDKNEKKPSDTLLNAKVDSHQIIIAEQQGLDEAEVLVEQLSTYSSVFREAHIHFRGIAKGVFSA